LYSVVCDCVLEGKKFVYVWVESKSKHL
jgi:hypothetical protein